MYQDRIVDRNDALLSQTASTITTNFPDVDIHSTVGDISSERFVNSIIEGVLERFGRVDYCVNCAGILSNNKNSTESSIEEFDRINKLCELSGMLAYIEGGTQSYAEAGTLAKS